MVNGRPVRRLIVSSVLALITSVSVCPRADAAVSNAVGACVGTDVGGDCLARSMTQSSSKERASSGESGSDGAPTEPPFDPCTYTVVDAERARVVFASLGRDPSLVAEGDQWVLMECQGEIVGGSAPFLADLYRLGSAPRIDLLVQQAADRLTLPLPEPRTAPPVGATWLVGMTNWFAVEPAAFTPQTITVAVPGAAVTLLATPTTTTWDLGDGRRIVCEGPGAGWTASSIHSDCTHVYQWSSTGSRGTASGTYMLTATVTWNRSWTCDPQCGSGDLGPLDRSTSFPITVRQAQAVITKP